MDEDNRYDGVLRELGKLYAAWQEHQARIATEIGEYKKTVNSAIGILGQESIRFQADTQKRLETDAAQREQRQRHADRKDIAVLTSVGCLIVLNALAVLVLIGTVAYLIWR